MGHLQESTTAVIVRGERWTDGSASEPYEAGWAVEALVFLRILERVDGSTGGQVHVEISPDGMHWVAEGAVLPLPTAPGEVTFARLMQFGNWLRLRADFPGGKEAMLLATLHLKG